MMEKIDKVDQSIVTHFAVLWLITFSITLIGAIILNGWWVLLWFVIGLVVSDRLAEWKEKKDYKVKGIYNLSDRFAQWRFRDVYEQILLNIKGEL
ncbi:hypothetical protein GO491_03040 [Flavobacteriaceae bacterium Ap0902]|nr:hypothetical protein [Flavobacteriaceae bacterium Ap0902]